MCSPIISAYLFWCVLTNVICSHQCCEKNQSIKYCSSSITSENFASNVLQTDNVDGGSLIYTSIKNNSNLNVLYEYILHRAYKMPLRHKPEAINEEAIFIPLGFDSPNLLEYLS